MANKPDPFLDNPFQTKQEWRRDYRVCKSEYDEPLRRNHVYITSQGIRETADVLDAMGSDVAYLKIGSIAAIYRYDVFDLIDLAKQHGIRGYLGGGFMESAANPKEAAKKVRLLQDKEIDTIEVSNSKGFNLSEMEEILKGCQNDGMHVLLEIGQKTRRFRDLASWRKQMDLQEYADRLIFEGGGTGDVGIYTSQGSPLTGLIWSLMQYVENPNEVIIEAPHNNQQVFMTGEFGYAQMLGNIECNISSLMDTRDVRLEHMNAADRARAKNNRNEAPQVLRRLQTYAETHRVNFDEILSNSGGTLRSRDYRESYEINLREYIASTSY